MKRIALNLVPLRFSQSESVSSLESIFRAETSGFFPFFQEKRLSFWDKATTIGVLNIRTF